MARLQARLLSRDASARKYKVCSAIDSIPGSRLMLQTGWAIPAGRIIHK
jgi:hypothetical protein